MIIDCAHYQDGRRTDEKGVPLPEVTSCYWQPSMMELTLINSSISFMSKSLKPWLNSSIQPKTS